MFEQITEVYSQVPNEQDADQYLLTQLTQHPKLFEQLKIRIDSQEKSLLNQQEKFNNLQIKIESFEQSQLNEDSTSSDEATSSGENSISNEIADLLDQLDLFAYGQEFNQAQQILQQLSFFDATQLAPYNEQLEKLSAFLVRSLCSHILREDKIEFFPLLLEMNQPVLAMRTFLDLQQKRVAKFLDGICLQTVVSGYFSELIKVNNEFSTLFEKQIQNNKGFMSKLSVWILQQTQNFFTWLRDPLQNIELKKINQTLNDILLEIQNFQVHKLNLEQITIQNLEQQFQFYLTKRLDNKIKQISIIEENHLYPMFLANNSYFPKNLVPKPFDEAYMPKSAYSHNLKDFNSIIQDSRFYVKKQTGLLINLLFDLINLIEDNSNNQLWFQIIEIESQCLRLLQPFIKDFDIKEEVNFADGCTLYFFVRTVSRRFQELYATYQTEIDKLWYSLTYVLYNEIERFSLLTFHLKVFIPFQQHFTIPIDEPYEKPWPIFISLCDKMQKVKQVIIQICDKELGDKLMRLNLLIFMQYLNVYFGNKIDLKDTQFIQKYEFLSKICSAKRMDMQDVSLVGQQNLANNLTFVFTFMQNQQDLQVIFRNFFNHQLDFFTFIKKLTHDGINLNKDSALKYLQGDFFSDLKSLL